MSNKPTSKPTSKPTNKSPLSHEKNDDLNAIFKKAEKLQVQLEASNLFKKNLDYFVGADATTYSEYIDFVPTNYQLLIDTNNQLNIIDLKSKQLVYNTDPKKIAKDQVINYIDKPFLLYTKLLKIPKRNENWIHDKIINETIDIFKKYNIEENLPSLDKIGFMVALGCGLGHHLNELANSFDIQHLFIVDSEKDFFYASLYSIDWPALCDHFTKKNGTIVLQIGKTPQQSVNHIINYRASIGLHNTSNTQFFTHFLNDSNIDFNKRLRKQFPFSASVGFFDDERISLAHTVYNLNKKHPILIDSKKEIENLPPVILIANGPSLDFQIPFIKENKNRAILISCGTALGTLYNLGIKPDIHIEMERCSNVAQFIDYGTDLTYTKSITLLCLNTVSPLVIKKFKDTFIAAKANDLGSNLIINEISDQSIKTLEDCNPTVSNAGLAFVCGLGFKEVFLTGTDFGMAKKEEHHSQDSVYFDFKTDGKNKHLIDSYKDAQFSKQYKTQGNLCDEVYTTQILDNSKRIIEILLHKNPQVSCINSCRGAFIKGTKAEKLENLNINNDEIIDKKEIITKILDDNFYIPKDIKITEEYIKMKYIPNISGIKKALTLAKTTKNIKTLHDDMSVIFSNLKTLEKGAPIICSLFEGSIQYHLALIYNFCIRTKTQKEFEECYRIGKKQLDSLVDGMIDIIDVRLMELDDTLSDFR